LHSLNPENLKGEYENFSSTLPKRRRSREKILPEEVLV